MFLPTTITPIFFIHHIFTLIIETVTYLFNIYKATLDMNVHMHKTAKYLRTKIYLKNPQNMTMQEMSVFFYLFLARVRLFLIKKF